jgi:hypothetical protein
LTPEIFAEWLRRRGYHVVRTQSSYWFDQGPRVYQAFPYHWLIDPSPDELKHLIKNCGACALRYSTSLSTPEGVASYHVVYEGENYPINQLSKKVRYDVKKGLSVARVEQIPFSRLATEGWQLRWETLQRQGRTRAETAGGWEQLCYTAEDLPGFETWAALSAEGNLVAALLAFTCDNCRSILYQQSLTAYLSLGVNNALAFAFTNEVLKRSGNPWIFYGLHSLDAPASVDEFKFRMGYTAKPVRQRVVFHPALEPFLNRATYSVLGQLCHWLPGNPFLAKAEGMLRFYQEGKRPLDLQTWPQVLRQSNAEAEPHA